MRNNRGYRPNRHNPYGRQNVNPALHDSVPGVQLPLREFEANTPDTAIRRFPPSSKRAASSAFGEGALAGDFDLMVGGEKNLSDMDYNYLGTVKCAQIQELIIDENTYFSYSDYLDQKKDSGTATAIVLGSMGGFVALLGFSALFKGAKAKAKKAIYRPQTPYRNDTRRQGGLI